MIQYFKSVRLERLRSPKRSIQMFIALTVWEAARFCMTHQEWALLKDHALDATAKSELK